ncbi:hypothetical protein PENSOL_c009G09922 [Penicillium solitum]|uniref:Uncharacterized protein n=1 Tax=Penicillium solitum TaxID=60172 RepID=A0A1V6RA85_9EURO|nr:uncharacterized protein PENSOL_c009G09922 [Penicillium solitum]OQD98504.1 hypothetical protein PENSOL_c009G09922 [Penicillium solitum]
MLRNPPRTWNHRAGDNLRSDKALGAGAEQEDPSFIRRPVEGIGINEMDYNKIVSNPQATRYVVNFMQQTGLLQQFQHVGVEEDDDDELTGLAAMDLGVKDDGY